jgi:hypothetical protein
MLSLRGEVCLVMRVQTILMRHDAIAPKDSRTCDDPVQSTARSQLRNSCCEIASRFLCATESLDGAHRNEHSDVRWPQPPRVVGHGQTKSSPNGSAFFHSSEFGWLAPRICYVTMDADIVPKTPVP